MSVALRPAWAGSGSANRCIHARYAAVWKCCTFLLALAMHSSTVLGCGWVLDSVDSCPRGYISSRYGTRQYCCSPCARGTYSAVVPSTECTSCTTGKFANVEGSSACSVCQGGTYSTSVSSGVCLNCVAGSYSAAGASLCTSCLAGFYSGVAGSSSCAACGPMTFASGAGSSACQSCSVCSIGNMASTDCSPTADTICVSRACLLCDAGLFVVNSCATEGERAVCSSCPKGTYSSEMSRAIACESCVAGTYASAVGSTVCVICANGTYSDREGLSACTSCATTPSCDIGEYRKSCGETSAGICEACTVNVA
jgi:syndecan 4